MRKGKATSHLRPGAKSHLLRLSLPFLRSKLGAEQENAGQVLCEQLSRVVGCWGGDLGFEPGYRAQQMAPLAWALRKAGQWWPVSFPCGPPGGSCYCHLVRSAAHLRFRVLTPKAKRDHETPKQAGLDSAESSRTGEPRQGCIEQRVTSAGADARAGGGAGAASTQNR